jgi:hypothetical protein
MAAFAYALLQLGCVQAGDAPRRTEPVCDPKTANCVRTPAPATLEPAVPPVPNSPLKIDCQRLPTQVERDTCVNRKQSTG